MMLLEGKQQQEGLFKVWLVLVVILKLYEQLFIAVVVLNHPLSHQPYIFTVLPLGFVPKYI